MERPVIHALQRPALSFSDRNPRPRATKNRRNLLCKIAIDTHTYNVNKSKDGETGDPRFAAPGFIVLKERQQHPQQACQAASEDTENFAVDEPDFGGDELEGLEHEEEVPLGLDSGRGGDKGVRLHTQVPGEDGGQRAEYTDRTGV